MTRVVLEIQRITRDRSIPALLLIFAIAAAFAAVVGAHRAAERTAVLALVEKEASDTRAERRALLVAERHGGAKAAFGTIYATAMPFRATLPVRPGHALAVGRSETYPQAAVIHPFADPETIFDRFGAGLENPAALGAGRFDLAFVITYILPLLLLAGSYDLWTGERERGTMPMLVAQPVSVRALVAHRVVARVALLLLPTSAILSVAIALAAPGWRATDALVLAAALLAYGGFWIALATAINLLVRRPVSAALACGAAWFALVVVAPAAAAALLDLRTPRPSALDHLNRVRTETVAARAAVAGWADAHPEAFDPARAYNKLLWTQRREAALRDRRIAPHAARHHGAADRRAALADGLRFLSPAVLVADLLERLAGTDAERARGFARQARAFTSETRAWSDAYMRRDRTLRVEDYDRGVPRFAFREPADARPVAADLAALLAMLAAVGLIAIALSGRRAAHGGARDA